MSSRRRMPPEKPLTDPVRGLVEVETAEQLDGAGARRRARHAEEAADQLEVLAAR